MGIMSSYIACKDFGINNEFVEAFDTYWETSKDLPGHLSGAQKVQLGF